MPHGLHQRHILPVRNRHRPLFPNIPFLARGRAISNNGIGMPIPTAPLPDGEASTPTNAPVRDVISPPRYGGFPVPGRFTNRRPPRPLRGHLAYPFPHRGVDSATDSNALSTSTVYRADRLANPETDNGPCTLKGIRRNDEIDGFVVRFFETHPVRLPPGLIGREIPRNLNPLNERIRPLYDSYNVPAGFSNRLSIGAGGLNFGVGRRRRPFHQGGGVLSLDTSRF